MNKVYLLLVPVWLVLFSSINEAHAAKTIDLLANGMQLSDQWVITDVVLSPSEHPGGIIWSKDIFDGFEISISTKHHRSVTVVSFFVQIQRTLFKVALRYRLPLQGCILANMLLALSMMLKSQLFM